LWFPLLLGSNPSTGFGGVSTFGATGGETKYAKTTGDDSAQLISITAMPAYKMKSVEELRWEDYQAGKHKKLPGSTRKYSFICSSFLGVCLL